MAVDEAIATSCISICKYYADVYYTGRAVIEWIVFVKVLIFYLYFWNECRYVLDLDKLYIKPRLHGQSVTQVSDGRHWLESLTDVYTGA